MSAISNPTSPTPWSFPLGDEISVRIGRRSDALVVRTALSETMCNRIQQKGLRTWGLVRNSHALFSLCPMLSTVIPTTRAVMCAVCQCRFQGLLWSPESDRYVIEILIAELKPLFFSHDALINAWFIPNPPWDQVDRKKNERNNSWIPRSGYRQKFASCCDCE